MIGFVRQRYCRRLFDNLLKKERNRGIMRYDEAKNILLLFVMYNEAAWHIVNECTQKMEQEGKEVELLGVLPADVEREFLVARTHTCLLDEKNNLNFWHLPRHEVVADLLNKRYDLLIDATGTPNLISQYIALMSDAAWRIAYSDRSQPQPKELNYSNEEIFDFVIRNDHPIDIPRYINDIEMYLKILKK